MSRKPVLSNPEIPDLAIRLARAIRTTKESYHGGFMSRPTYQKHLGGLWGQVDAAGFRDIVEAIHEVEQP